MSNCQRLAAIMMAAIGLSACESDFHHHGPYAGVDVAYVDGYYDDAYGPVYDGYWGDGDVFYYRDGPTANSAAMTRTTSAAAAATATTRCTCGPARRRITTSPPAASYSPEEVS